ncbi:uncharacterized protein LOC133185070 [Saccostrea echinata]|uniref:uncharacterized protein LOC133185070 n=1 Tax=Saccostrea echinata TaxID=191078 RepID=UPI002A809CDE|nr:uncharacterized protein LOC133185070 [Saccostrea echinata]
MSYGCCDNVNTVPAQPMQRRKCRSGYFGINCSWPCRYPNYGEDCQSKCNCEEHMCNISYECRYNNVNTVTAQTRQKSTYSTKYRPQKMDSSVNFIMIGILTSVGFFLVIISIIVIANLNRKHFSQRIRQTEQFIDSVMVDNAINRGRDT